MADESVPGGNDSNVVSLSTKADQPAQQLEEPRTERDLFQGVCDHEMIQGLWEVQCILRLVDMADEAGSEVIRLAVRGAERLLASQINRTGCSGMGDVGPVFEVYEGPKT